MANNWQIVPMRMSAPDVPYKPEQGTPLYCRHCMGLEIPGYCYADTVRVRPRSMYPTHMLWPPSFNGSILPYYIMVADPAEAGSVQVPAVNLYGRYVPACGVVEDYSCRSSTR